MCLSGALPAIASTGVAGRPLSARCADAWWRSSCEQTHEFFRADCPLWRLPCLPPAAVLVWPDPDGAAGVGLVSTTAETAAREAGTPPLPWQRGLPPADGVLLRLALR